MTTLTTQRIGTVHANGIDHHYVETGSPDSPALVLLHGGLVSTGPLWDDAEIALFEVLLEEQDVDIMAWAMGTATVPARYEGTIMNALKTLNYVPISR